MKIQIEKMGKYTMHYILEKNGMCRVIKVIDGKEVIYEQKPHDFICRVGKGFKEFFKGIFNKIQIKVCKNE